MTAIVIPFPRTRDRRFVIRHAGRMAELSHASAEKYLGQQIATQAEVMTRRSIAANLIAEQLQALETAIRAELWHMVIYGRDGAA